MRQYKTATRHALIYDDEDSQECRAPTGTPRRTEEHLPWVPQELLAAEQHHGDEVQRAVYGKHPPEYLPEVRDLHPQARVDVRVDDRAGREVEAEGAQALGQRGFCEALGEDGVVLLGDALKKMLDDQRRSGC